MKYQKIVLLGGAWVKAAEVKSGTRAKIVSETINQPSSFVNKDGSSKTQDVAKLWIEGVNEPLNVSLNRATINALVDAFGEDSVAWQGRYLTIETEKIRVAGKSKTALYLIPEGYVKIDDENGYAKIVKKEMLTKNSPEQVPPPEDPGEINVEDIPF
jgi:hypothetical protein